MKENVVKIQKKSFFIALMQTPVLLCMDPQHMRPSTIASLTDASTPVLASCSSCSNVSSGKQTKVSDNYQSTTSTHNKSDHVTVITADGEIFSVERKVLLTSETCKFCLEPDLPESQMMQEAKQHKIHFTHIPGSLFSIIYDLMCKVPQLCALWQIFDDHEKTHKYAYEWDAYVHAYEKLWKSYKHELRETFHFKNMVEVQEHQKHKVDFISHYLKKSTIATKLIPALLNTAQFLELKLLFASCARAYALRITSPSAAICATKIVKLQTTPAAKAEIARQYYLISGQAPALPGIQWGVSVQELIDHDRHGQLLYNPTSYDQLYPNVLDLSHLCISDLYGLESLHNKYMNGRFIYSAYINKLKLNNNNITTFAPTCFEHFYNLKKIDLRENMIDTLPPGAFKNLPHNITVDLRHNLLPPALNRCLKKKWIKDEDGNIQCTYDNHQIKELFEPTDPIDHNTKRRKLSD